MVSYGGGANSTALLIGLHQHRIPVDLILFADTGAEHPHTYAYLEVMDRWLKDHGMPPIIRVYKTTRAGKRLTLESKDYDAARAALDAALAEAGGYLESSDEYANSGSRRSLSLTLRVPQENYESFLAAVAATGNVTYKSQQAEDVTTQYMDIEARLDSLKEQRARLQELKASADNLSDLLQIESSLSDVQYQLESYQSQLDWYSRQVECCTVYLSLEEVQTYTPVEEGFGSRIQNALREGWSGFVETVQSAAVFLVGHWPFIVVGAVCGVIFYKARHPKHKKQK